LEEIKKTSLRGVRSTPPRVDRVKRGKLLENYNAQNIEGDHIFAEFSI
jgi:hypothetical protein